jgi:altronate hydrolase
MATARISARASLGEVPMSAPTQTNLAAAIRLHPDDNVVIAARRIAPGETPAGEPVAALEPIPAGHKMATAAIAAGAVALKYGQVIGAATRDIAPGAHVHTHNLEVSDQRLQARPRAPSPREERTRTFMGFRRPDGRVGTRNYVGVLTSVNCSATVARAIASAAARSGMLSAFPNVDGVVPITHTSGCGMMDAGEGYDLLRRTLWGTAANPNFGAILLVGLGCEVLQIGRFAQDFGLAGRADFQSFTIQDAGGTRKAVEAGLARLGELLAIANAARRAPAPARELVLGLQCGGSDAWSGVTSNPALGDAADRLVALGGTVILSETPEIYGAEHLLYARAVSPEVSARLAARLAWWERYTARHGATMDNNPSPGNKAGGLSTILEKSLGAVSKAGSSALADVIEYGEPLRARGLVFMDSPGFDPCSATGQVASGATLIAFTTGRGSGFGCKPSPSIKLSSNSDLFRRMSEDIDIDCGPIATGASSIAAKGAEILDCLLDVASGRRSKSEDLGYGDAEFAPWILGPTM